MNISRKKSERDAVRAAVDSALEDAERDGRGVSRVALWRGDTLTVRAERGMMPTREFSPGWPSSGHVFVGPRVYRVIG